MVVTVTDEGRLTLGREVLEHLGVRPGDRVTVDLLPARRIRLRARPKRPLSAMFGRLARDGEPPLTIDEIREISEKGWAGED